MLCRPQTGYPLSLVAAKEHGHFLTPAEMAVDGQDIENSPEGFAEDSMKTPVMAGNRAQMDGSPPVLRQAEAQTSRATIDLALELGEYYLSQHNYQTAILEFKRFLFFHRDDERIGKIHALLSLAYAEQEQWEPAIKHLNLAIQNAHTDSLAESYRITQASYYLAQQLYGSAEIELTRLAHFSDYAAIRDKSKLLLVLCHVYQGKWHQAHQRLAEVADHLPSPLWAKIDSVLRVASETRYKSPRAAKWLSTFLPGAGQIYDGNWWSGLNALVLNAATGYVLYTAAVGKQIGDILIAYMTLFDRYYQGNRVNAERVAVNYNQRVHRRLAREILSIMAREP